MYVKNVQIENEKVHRRKDIKNDTISLSYKQISDEEEKE